MICSGLFGIVLLVVCSISLVVTGFPFKTGNGQYWKRMCDSIEEVADNSTCQYGVWKNPCGKWACLSGVGGNCDENLSAFRHGRCANNLMCVCDKCQGCIRGLCYNSLLDCPRNMAHSKRMNYYPVEYTNNYNNYNEY